VCIYKKNLKVQKEPSKVVNQKTDNTMSNIKKRQKVNGPQNVTQKTEPK